MLFLFRTLEQERRNPNPLGESNAKRYIPQSPEFGTRPKDTVNHPPPYTAGGIETIDFIEAKQLNYHLGQVIKYITRAEHKNNSLEDLQKAQWYLNREIENRSKT